MVHDPHSFFPCMLSPRSKTVVAQVLYQPSVILLTGGAGFIGSHVVLRLAHTYPNYRIIVLDKLDMCASRHNLEAVIHNSNVRLVVGDIADTNLMRRILIDNQVDTVMHFAAQTHVDNSFGNSIHFTDQNIRGTHSLLESVKSVKPQVRRFIHVSTDEVYGEGDVGNETRLSEHASLNPTNPYAATKCGAEFLVKSYAVSFGIPAMITRGNNVFGPHQFPEKVIPKFITLLSTGQPCPIHGLGNNRRSFLYVTDVAAAFDLILHRGETLHIYNIGSSEDMEISTNNLCRMLIGIFRQHYPQYLDNSVPDEHYIKHVADRTFNDQRYHIDSSALYALGWKMEKADLRKQLKECIDWYISHPNHWPKKVVTAALAAHPTPTPTPDAEPSRRCSGDTNQPLRWLVFGHKGWIGQQVVQLLQGRGEVVLPARARANDVEAVEREILLTRPDRILSLIGRTYGPGYTTIDYLEQKDKLVENVNDNLYAPLVLATLGHKHNIHLTYLGTGCVFTYDEQHPLPRHARCTQADFDIIPSTDDVVMEPDMLGFSESDRPNFFSSSYSTVKGFTDQLMALQFSGSALNIRIRMPITSCGSTRNFISKITTYERICSIPNSMTVLPELLPIMLDMAAVKETGTVNLTNPGYISHNQVLQLYRDIVEPSFTWKNFSQAQQDAVLAAGRSNNVLSTIRLQKFAPHVTNIYQAVTNIMHAMRQRKRLADEQLQGTTAAQ